MSVLMQRSISAYVNIKVDAGRNMHPGLVVLEV